MATARISVEGRSDFVSASYSCILDRINVYCHCDHMSMIKDERLQVRVDPGSKSLLERAAQASHVSVSAFVLQSATARAVDVLAQRQFIELSPGAAAAFNDALGSPATVNQRLSAALGRVQKFTWID